MLVEVVTVAYVDDEKRVDNSLVQILKLMFRQDFEAKVWSLFCCSCLGVVSGFEV